MIIRPVVALVTAFNEEQTIGAVLDVLRNSPGVDRIQVVDDGSTDATRRVAEARGVTVLSLPERIPVGQAIMHHFEAIPESECTLLWCDADLLNLTTEHIATILDSLDRSDVSMSIGVKDNIPFLLPMHASLLPRPLLRLLYRLFYRLDIFLGGERAVHKSVMERAVSCSDLATGYGIVVLLNWFARCRADGYVYQLMPRLTHRKKHQKWGIRALAEFPKEFAQFIIAYVQIRRRLRHLRSDGDAGTQ
ncbi:MAG: glycosyltransferase family 2 protein [Lentisphaerae bacterium]|nr:glycosyltransferase family 2 protein [Lentisphaerota bacterium]